MKRLVAMAAAALLLAPAAPAFGKEELRALSVCGPVLCNIVRDTGLIADLDRFFASEKRTGPPPLESFFGVDTVIEQRSNGRRGVLPGSRGCCGGARPPARHDGWPCPTRVAASLRRAGAGAGPYEPGVTQATAGGKPAKDAAGYADLFDDVQEATPPAGETIPLVLRFRAVGRRPWPKRYRYAPSTNTLVSEGRAMRVSNETASLIERDAGLAGGGEGTSRWALRRLCSPPASPPPRFVARRVRRRPTR